MMMNAVALFIAAGVLLLSTESCAQKQVQPANEPLSMIAGSWKATGFSVGRELFDAHPCGEGKVTSSSERTASLSVACANVGDYSFRLERSSEPKAYLLTVKSRIGINVERFPVRYVGGRGWRGERKVVVDGKKLPVSGIVGRIEGQEWFGWTVLVIPTSDVGDIRSEGPLFKLDLTRRK